MNRDGDDNNLGDAFGPQQQQQQQQQQQDQNNEAEVEDDHDEDDEDDDGMDRDENRVLDGGVAGSANANDDSSTAAPRRRAVDCDLILYIACSENMDRLIPNHPVLKEGVVVSIGLDKNTKLSAVFNRYTEFCNEYTSSNPPIRKVVESELEFFHCQLLNGNDTAESSALMKNDRIKVRQERAAVRDKQAELKRIQRESDKEYFKQLRQLMPDSWASGGEKSDLIIDCQGKNSDGNVRHQPVLTTVRGHSTVLAKRCKWLGSLIQKAREDLVRCSVVTSDAPQGKEIEPASPHSDNRVEEEEEFPTGNIIVANTSATLAEDTCDDMDEDDEIAVLPLPVPHNNRSQPQEPLQQGGAAEILDEENGSVVESMVPASGSRRNSGAKSAKDALTQEQETDAQDAVKLRVTVHHTPEAVKILLEYCYTNRVFSLGHDAFVQACKTKPSKTNGPILPYSSARKWPNHGLPSVSFAAALDAISLAEEAGLPRLSLMCEVAASQLVREQNCVEALSKCTSQKELTGNDLPRLREVAISVVLRCGPCGVYDSSRFKEALEGRTTSIIPALFNGTVEAIANSDKNKSETRKRNRGAILENYFDEHDREDRKRRSDERNKRRRERDPTLAAEHIVKNDDETGDLGADNEALNWQDDLGRRSLKRMSQHLNVGGGFHMGRSAVYASREAFGNRVGYGIARRRASRRRSSERS